MTSPWPPVASIGALLMFFSFVAFFAAMRALAWPLLAVGVALTLIGSIGWWIALVKEQLPGPPPPGMPGQTSDFKLGWILFIASELMFFAAFFGFLFYSRFRATTWPPEGVPLPVHDLTLPGVMTVLLVTSGLTYTFAESSLMAGRRPAMIVGLGLTTLLGLAFLGIQAYEWAQSALKITDGLLGSAFYMLTGFHGVHVIIGVLFILVNLWRALLGHFTPERHFGLQAAGWYWHFVDVIWILLFVVLYLPLVSGGGH
jgi:cytochrome c oxidase subunit 3